MSRGIRNVPSGLQRDLQLHLMGIKSALDDLLSGGQRAVRYDELEDLVRGAPTTPGNSDTTIIQEPDDPRPPSAPDELAAAGGSRQITLRWNSGFNLTYLGTEIWGRRVVNEWNAATTYALGELVLGPSPSTTIYKAIQGGNLNHAVTDVAWWTPALEPDGVTPLAIMTDRVQLDTVAGTYYVFLAYGEAALGNETWAFWVRNVDENGLTSEFYPADDVGISESSGKLIPGNSIDLSSPPAIGSVTPNTGAFTALSATGNTTLGDASGDTVAIQAGTAALPTLIPAGDPDTGLWFPAANTIAWSTAGTERMRLDATGSMGVGVTPSAWSTLKGIQIPAGSFSGFAGGGGNNQLHFCNNAYYGSGGWTYITTDTAQRYTTSAGAHRFFIAASGTAGAVISFTQAMILNASGNLGIGTLTPSNILSLGGDSARTIWMERHATANTAGNNLTIQAGGATSGATDKNGGNLLLQSGTATGTGSSVIAFSTATAGTTGTTDRTVSEKMRVDGAGNVGIGTTTFGTSAATVLGIKTGTAPTTGPADTIQLYSTDLSAGNTMLSLYTEGTCVNANTTADTTHRIAIRVNGTVYYLLANTAA